MAGSRELAARRHACGGLVEGAEGRVVAATGGRFHHATDSRTGRERVRYPAPPAGRVADEMQALLSWIEAPSSFDPVRVATQAHLWFVTMHPFEDGNGRIARAIADLALARSERSAHQCYSLSAQIRAERAAYDRVLERTQQGDGELADSQREVEGDLGTAMRCTTGATRSRWPSRRARGLRQRARPRSSSMRRSDTRLTLSTVPDRWPVVTRSPSSGRSTSVMSPSWSTANWVMPTRQAQPCARSHAHKLLARSSTHVVLVRPPPGCPRRRCA